MSRSSTVMATIAAVAILVTGFVLRAPEVSAPPTIQGQGSQAPIVLAQFNPCPNGKCKF